MSFVEFEHKFIVSDAFDFEAFHQQALKHQPEEHYQVEVTDT